MSTGKMHADEININTSLVRRLLASQFPQWAKLPIMPVRSAGTDNALYRLGKELAVRLPRIGWAAGQMEKEHDWLPKLAPHLPLAIPAPLAQGVPGEGYPWRWSIYRWLAGVDLFARPLSDQRQLARDLARFIAALRRIDTTGAPPADRGVPLAQRDADTRAAIAALRGMLDTEAATAAWEAALRAPEWDGPPTWLHGDLLPTNLLVRGRRLSAVIDFGGLGVGDPACDLMPAWSILAGESRQIFRAALAVDNAMWARGRGWALSVALIALPYYRTTNPILASISRRSIDAVLAER